MAKAESLQVGLGVYTRFSPDSPGLLSLSAGKQQGIPSCLHSVTRQVCRAARAGSIQRRTRKPVCIIAAQPDMKKSGRMHRDVGSTGAENSDFCVSSLT